ncbi:hypothetical protein JHK85_056218 [Glycine max]|uniref:Rx N-terminal domain-containing protein n=1 Tax=Glycine max TaxID=3847 RepID=A0A0R0E734_SOYBN|nr:hypothetical protein JHK85_056218 [Glycine max]KAH1034642.1 hypothetical protein GYH30_054869 [Glycine max]
MRKKKKVLEKEEEKTDLRARENVKTCCKASREFQDFFSSRKLNVFLLDELKIKLLALNVVLNDAEEKQIIDLAVKAWLDELKDVVYDAKDFVSRRVSYRTITYSLVEFFLVEKEDDKEKLLNMLLFDDEKKNNIEVITIIGMGGLGKTTLAQSLYNDSEVQKSMGSVGDDCYNELLSRSLIEKDNVEVNRNFKMQDLIYDLSRLVSGKSSCNIEHDFSFTSIKMLPEATFMLYNLHTLKLLNCKFLIQLLRQIGNLVNLRHLDISGTNLGLPTQICKLQDLPTLTSFVISKQDGLRIMEFRRFPHLWDKLSILELQNVNDVMDAIQANLKKKEQIEELVLEWDNDPQDSQIAKDVLQNLQPSTN